MHWRHWNNYYFHSYAKEWNTNQTLIQMKKKISSVFLLLASFSIRFYLMRSSNDELILELKWIKLNLILKEPINAVFCIPCLNRKIANVANNKKLLCWSHSKVQTTINRKERKFISSCVVGFLLFLCYIRTDTLIFYWNICYLRYRIFFYAFTFKTIFTSNNFLSSFLLFQLLSICLNHHTIFSMLVQNVCGLSFTSKILATSTEWAYDMKMCACSVA